MKPEHQAIIDRIEQVRWSRHMTKTSFCSAIGLTTQTYSNFTCSRCKPNVNAVLGVCRAFKVDPRWIMFGEEGADFGFPGPIDPVRAKWVAT